MIFVRRPGERAYHQAPDTAADALCGDALPQSGWPDRHPGYPSRKMRCVKCENRAARFVPTDEPAPAATAAPTTKLPVQARLL